MVSNVKPGLQPMKATYETYGFPTAYHRIYCRKFVTLSYQMSHYICKYIRMLNLIHYFPIPYFMCANSKGSGETAQMRRLAWAFAGRLCDKYHNLLSWLIFHFFPLLQYFSTVNAYLALSFLMLSSHEISPQNGAWISFFWSRLSQNSSQSWDTVRYESRSFLAL